MGICQVFLHKSDIILTHCVLR